MLFLSCGGSGEIEETRYPDGALRVRRSVKLDEDGTAVTHGSYVSWRPDGKKEAEGTYRDGKREGRFTFWHSNGAKAREGDFKDGRQEGVWTAWNEDGTKAEEGEYSGGRRVGLWTAYYPGGARKSETEYRDGQPVGETKLWDASGQPIANSTR
jgi:antitoxin component YwqK of YwqJK toxin-antitoxin module